MKKLFLFLFAITFPLIIYAEESFFPIFTPPKNWLLSDPTLFEEGIQVGFIQSQRKIFTPAISLSLEHVGNISLQDYLKAVKKLHTRNPRNRYRELGTLSGACGELYLTQVDTKNQWGNIRILQAITLHQGYAVIQTATALEKDFPSLQQDFLNSFRSLTLAPNLLASLSSSSEANELKEKLGALKRSWKKYCRSSSQKKESLFSSDFFQKNQWKPFIEYFTKTFKSQDACWQFMAVKTIQEQLLEER